jgi:hypothetical protein
MAPKRVPQKLQVYLSQNFVDLCLLLQPTQG